MNILCFGDSNTYGYNPKNGLRYKKNVRWTGILQKLLGENYKVIEEGLNGRTTVFDDPFLEGRCGLNDITKCLNLHKPIDLLIVMLGTNDTKEIFNADANTITKGLETLLNKAMSSFEVFTNNKPNILIIAPFPIRPEIINTFWISSMGKNCSKKSYELIEKYKNLAKSLNCHFFDPSPYGICSDYDYLHLSEETHNILAHKLYELILNMDK